MNLNFDKVFIVAELSANHGRDINIAIESIRGAKRAGANAIKLQTYTPETMTINSKSRDFIINNGSIWDGENFYDLYKKAFTPWEWHEKLFEIAKEEGLICFSTPFDKSSVDFLEKLNNPIYKIASFEITDIPLIDYVATLKKPIILSTGIAKKNDVELAIKTIRKRGNNNIALLKCTSSYPAPLDEANLIMIKEFKDDFGVITGLSDHTMGIIAPIVATTLGAKIIEKHFILDKSIGGPDSTFSLDEEEFKTMVNAVRFAEISIGKKDYNLTQKQIKSRDFSRSIYIVKDVIKGQTITNDNVRSIRPGFSLEPKYLNQIIGLKFNKNLKKGDRISFDHIL